ncbi:hypothetical protein PoB_005125600 [Plakobranchus ocellatus]|uniref:Uncharacterized protein n=1 Tax=Plakobranchus ocellatus TaxID=259542 RepID=A0AAV4C059_9GAST|nr:hypothetical protein PoB_005125600 [Plakobranchus ocellatus]
MDAHKAQVLLERMLSEFPDSDNESEATTEVVDELCRLQNEASTSTATELCNTNSETEASIEPTVTIDVINQLYHTQNDVSSSDTGSCDTHSQSDHYSDPDYVPESNNITNSSLPLSSQETSPVDTNWGANFDPEPFSEETDQEASTKKIRPRKRKRKPEIWLQNVRSKKIAAGEPYINKSGKHVPGRSIGNSCSCKKRCFEQVGEENIQKTFSQFYQLPSKDLQDAY